MRHTVLSLLTLFLLASCGAGKNVFITAIPSCPSAESGYELGVSACFAGRLDGTLIMAGGCNFPEPGKKRYYQGIYAADISDGSLAWRLAGMLPEPVAYGVTVGCKDSLIFIGGNNNAHSLTSVYSIRLSGGKALVNRLPSLPCTTDNMAGAMSGDEVFVIGGNQDGQPSTRLLRYSCATGEWSEAGYIPGSPRVQPVCASVRDRLYVWGGFHADGADSRVHTDGYSFDIRTATWSALPAPADSLGNSLTLSGGIASRIGSSDTILCLGGVNKDIFLDAISGRYELVAKEDYLKKEPSWYKFNPAVLVFDTTKNSWRRMKTASSEAARAGAMLVESINPNEFFYIGGETKPSVRTPVIAHLKIAR